MTKRLLSFMVLLCLSLLIVSPVFGWHIHHSCSNCHHGFETHSSSHAEHGSHPDECQAENLYQHVTEQGMVLKKAEPVVIYTDIAFLFTPVSCVVPLDSSIENKTWTDSDVGYQVSSYFISSIAFRAPPQQLS